jgi:hypothetical protein
MTPDEAKKKRCPIKPIFTYGEGRYGPAPFLDECKADDCMMWRWNNAEHTDGYCELAGKE